MSEAMNRLLWKLGRAPAPIGVDLVLTDDCNLKCSYCARWGSPDASRSASYMDVPSALRLVDELALVSPKPFIRLFGGEPFLHPEWDGVVRHARSKGVWCTAVTNGMLLEEQAQRLVASGLLAVGVSLDGHAAIQDKVRGKTTFERIMAGLEALRKSKTAMHSPHPMVEIYLTVQPANVGHLAEFAFFLKEHEIVLLRLQHLIWCTEDQFDKTRSMLADRFPGQPVLEDEAAYRRKGPPDVDPEEFLQQKRILEEDTWPFKVEFHPVLPDPEWRAFLTSPDCGRRNLAPCKNMEKYAYIRPSGSMRPCLSVEVGNVFDTPFSKVWNGSPMRRFRRLVRKNGRLPICGRCPD